VQRQVSEVHKQQLQAVCALGCVHFMGMSMGMGTDFVLPAALSSASPCLPLACASLPVLLSARAGVISRASATIRASHIVAPRHLSNRILHTLQFFQCQSDCCRFARQCELTRTVVGWPSSIRYTKTTRRGSIESRSRGWGLQQRASPQALCPNLGGLHDVIRLSTLHEYAAVLHSPKVLICGDGDAPPSQLSLARRGPQPCWPKAELHQ
jgi:hypothetical protein